MCKEEQRTFEKLLEEVDEDKACLCCGSYRTWRNSSGELQCDNCGHSETE